MRDDQPSPVAIATQNSRVLSLDVFRGLTIAGMILVTDPGTYQTVYGPLLHADWNGWTPTDMIFPSFLFIAGVAMTLSFAARLARGDTRGKLVWHVIWRSAVLFAIGLLLNGFPGFDLDTWRIPGVLQRIAICYLCGGLLYLAVDSKRSGSAPRHPGFTGFIPIAVIAILIGYWMLLAWVPVPGFGAGRLDSLGNLGAYIDRSVFGTRHLWPYGLTPGHSVTYDPEGLLSTIPAIATLLIGILAGEWMRGNSSGSKKVAGLVGAGIGLLLAGWLLGNVFPINKRLWTSTFVVFSSGFSMVAFSLCYWIVDLRRWRWWTPPALVFGTNATVAFVLSIVLTTLTNLIHVHVGIGSDGLLTFHEWGYRCVSAPWLTSYNASLAYGLAIVLLNMAIVSVLYRRRIFLRI